jgi:hypothetical protein
MLIQLTNLPTDITHDDIDGLLDHMSSINKITLVESGNPDNLFAWIELECSHVGCSAICELLNHQYLKGRHITAYGLLYSH